VRIKFLSENLFRFFVPQTFNSSTEQAKHLNEGFLTVVLPASSRIRIGKPI
jgi:hypothetical protein